MVLFFQMEEYEQSKENQKHVNENIRGDNHIKIQKEKCYLKPRLGIY